MVGHADRFGVAPLTPPLPFEALRRLAPVRICCSRSVLVVATGRRGAPPPSPSADASAWSRPSPHRLRPGEGGCLPGASVCSLQVGGAGDVCWAHTSPPLPPSPPLLSFTPFSPSGAAPPAAPVLWSLSCFPLSSVTSVFSFPLIFSWVVGFFSVPRCHACG